MEHENEHLDIREKLLRLPKIQADDNFLKRLQIQIDILDSEERTRDVVDKGSVSGYFKNLFGNRLMPALGISTVVVAAFLVYFILADNKDGVVNNITGNKNTETVITHEKEGGINSSPSSEKKTENKELAKTEESNSQIKTDTKSSEPPPPVVYEKPEIIPEKPQPVVTEESNLSQTVQPVTPPQKIDVEQSGRIISPDEIEKSGIRGTTNLKSAKSVKGDTKKSSDNADTSTDEIKLEPKKSSDQEKTVNEGGRGNTEKKENSGIKPKKKDLNGVIEINKSVLESLRDKLK